MFRLANATPAGSQIKTPTAALTIIDNEGPGTLDFGSGAYTVVESAGAATVTVNRIGASNLKLSVDYATQAGLTDPATATTDYTPISPARTLTFDPGEMSKSFQVAIADDSDAEGAETVGVVLSNPRNLTAGTAPQIGPNGPAQVTINDDDVSTFVFTAHEYSVDEEAASGHATISVRRSGATNIAASVDYATSDGTATAASGDYTTATGTLAFAAGETGQDVRRPRRQRRRGGGERDREPDAHERCDVAAEHRRQRQPEGERPAVEPGLRGRRGRRRGDGHRDAQPSPSTPM